MLVFTLTYNEPTHCISMTYKCYGCSGEVTDSVKQKPGREKKDPLMLSVTDSPEEWHMLPLLILLFFL